MAYNVISGEIVSGVLYYVAGEQSVIYNSATFNTGEKFRGASAVNAFAYSGVGTKELNEVIELKGGAIEHTEIGSNSPVFDELTILESFAIEYELNDAEKLVNEVTTIKGFALELIDYPFYSFEIVERIL